MFVILAAVIVFLFAFDWNHAKPWINKRVSASIGRPFAINGDLSITWHRPQTAEPGWRDRVPWPHVIARNIMVGENIDQATRLGRAGPAHESVWREHGAFVSVDRHKLLPETPPFATEGHLSGAMNALGSDWTYENFKGRVGSSDIGGTRHLKLKQLFPTFQPMQASLGEINGDASLSATGNSIAALLGASNGEIKTVINQGTN